METGTATYSGEFTRRLWAHTDDLIAQLVHCSFVEELASGSLTPARFAIFVGQDALYQRAGSRIVHELSTSADCTTEESKFLSLFAVGAADFAETLINRLTVEFDRYTEPDPDGPKKALITHVSETATEGVLGDAVAAMLPCYSIGNVLAGYLSELMTDSNPFLPWLALYANELLASYAHEFVVLTERVADRCLLAERENMADSFRKSMMLELEFFEAL